MCNLNSILSGCSFFSASFLFASGGGDEFDVSKVLILLLELDVGLWYGRDPDVFPFWFLLSYSDNVLSNLCLLSAFFLNDHSKLN
jgi:hypothetical protein